MKHLFIALFFFLILCPAFGQNNIVKTAGVSYTAGAPTFTPGRTGSQVAIDTVTGLWYEHNGTSWSASGYRVQTISGCSAPAYTPAKYQSRLVINACTAGQGGPELYYYTGSVWLQINEGQTYTAGTGINITGGVISATSTGGPDSTFQETNGSFLYKRPTDNIYKSGGTLGVRTTDTLGVFNVSQNDINKPAEYLLINGAGMRTYQRVRNPSPGWSARNGDWFESGINDGIIGNGSANFPGIVDTLPNVVWRRGQDHRFAPSMFESDETNYWQTATLGPNPSAGRNVYEKHWQVIDSGGYQHRPLSGFFEKRNNGYGYLDINVSLLGISGWKLEQDAILSLNRGGLSNFIGQANFYKDSLRLLNLSDISKNSVLHLGSAYRGIVDPNGRSNFLTIGGDGRGSNVVGFGALYTNTNNFGDLDAIFTTQTGSTQFERMRIKGGDYAVGIKRTNPLQELHVGGDILAQGTVRANMSGDSAAIVAKYNTTQTNPIFKMEYSDGSTAAYSHVYNISNPTLVFGKVGSVGASAQSNTLFGFTTANFGVNASNNTLFGNNVGNSITTAYENDFSGSGSGQGCTTCNRNVAGGAFALFSCTTCNENMTLGRAAMYSCINGYGNVGIAPSVLNSATNPRLMVVIGIQGAQNATTAENSVVIGPAAAALRTTILNSVIIGNNASNLAGSAQNQLWIDNSNTATPLIGGDFSNNSVGINTAPGSISASAALEITSTTQGFLPPRMTQAQRDAISSPATALTLYCTDCTATDASTGVMQTYNGTTWKNAW
jgi:hypothetical protein